MSRLFLDSHLRIQFVLDKLYPFYINLSFKKIIAISALVFK